MRCMTILILSNKSGAMVDFRYELIMELCKNNSVYILTPFDDKMDKLQSMPVQLIEVDVDRRGVNPFRDFKLIQRYIKVIDQINPDIVITYTIKPNIYGGIACRITHKAYATNITGLGTAFQRDGLLKKIVIQLYRIALKKANVVFFENNGNREELVSYDICKREKTHVLNGAGVNLGKFCYQPYPNNEYMKFLFVGRVMKEKGIDELFEVVKRLDKEGKKCFLDIVGPFEEDYKDKLDKYEKQGWLKYHGYQDDVRPFISNCDCFVLPSYHEGMANTNLEAAASGRPVITSNIPGCKESVIEGISGFLCEPMSVDSLYTVIYKMLNTSRSDRVEMGKAGRRHMEESFDKVKVVQETISGLLS